MFFQKTQVDSQHPNGGSQLFVTTVPGDQCPLLASGTRHFSTAQSCRQNTPTHEIIKFKKEKEVGPG